MDATARTAGVDVGGTKVAVATLDGTALRDHEPEPTAQGGPEELIDQIVRLVQAQGPVAAVGVGVPSVIRLADGMVMSSANLHGLRDVPLRDLLSQRLQLPVALDNDANLAALSEVWDDDLTLQHRSLACLTVGTGIGSGIAIDGEPLHGSTTSAVELGHLTVAADLTAGAPIVGDAPLPSSLEYWASGRALDRLALERGYQHGPAITDAAHSGDPDAIEGLRILGERLGVGVAAVITLLEPEVVAIGGGVSRAGELLVGPARAAAQRLLLPGLGATTVIRTAQHGPHAGVRGAALLARLRENQRS